MEISKLKHKNKNKIIYFLNIKIYVEGMRAPKNTVKLKSCFKYYVSLKVRTISKTMKFKNDKS